MPAIDELYSELEEAVDVEAKAFSLDRDQRDALLAEVAIRVLEDGRNLRDSLRRTQIRVLSGRMASRMAEGSANREITGLVLPREHRTPYEILWEAQQREMVGYGLSRIFPSLRECLLAHIRGVSFEDIAVNRGLSVTTARIYVNRAQREIRDEIVGKYGSRDIIFD